MWFDTYSAAVAHKYRQPMPTKHKVVKTTYYSLALEQNVKCYTVVLKVNR